MASHRVTVTYVIEASSHEDAVAVVTQLNLSGLMARPRAITRHLPDRIVVERARPEGT